MFKIEILIIIVNMKYYIILMIKLLNYLIDYGCLNKFKTTLLWLDFIVYKVVQ